MQKSRAQLSCVVLATLVTLASGATCQTMSVQVGNLIPSPPAPPFPPPVPNSPPVGSYEMDVGVSDPEGEGGSSLRKLLTAKSVTLERLIVYDLTNTVIPTSDLSFVFEASDVAGSETYQQKTQKMKDLSNADAQAVTFDVPVGGESVLFTIVAQVEIGAIDIDIDDSNTDSGKQVHFVKTKWDGVAQSGTDKAQLMQTRSAVRANGSYKSRYFDFRTSNLPNTYSLSRVTTVPWGLPARFDSTVYTHVDDVQNIMFRFKSGQHDVMRMASQAAFVACDFAGATPVSAGGLNVNTGGPYYFASSISDDCNSGLKQTFMISPLESPPPPNPPPNPPPPPPNPNPPSPNPPPILQHESCSKKWPGYQCQMYAPNEGDPFLTVGQPGYVLVICYGSDNKKRFNHNFVGGELCYHSSGSGNYCQCDVLRKRKLLSVDDEENVLQDRLQLPGADDLGRQFSA